MSKRAKTDGSDSDSEAPSLELDPEVQEQLDKVENDLFNIGEAYAKRLGELDREFDKKRAPVYKERDAVLAKIPNFWLKVFLNHHLLQGAFSPDDLAVLEYLETFTASSTTDRGGLGVYSVSFGFRENPYFKNDVLTKKVKETLLVDQEECKETIESTRIEWKEGKDFTKPPQPKEKKRSRDEQTSFFGWFCGDDTYDSLIEVLTEDVYISAVELFANPDGDIDVGESPAGSADSEFEDEDEGDEEEDADVQ